MTLRRAAAWSLIHVVLALLFGAGLGLASGWDLAGQYLAGYVVEKSLSIDNLFVFVVIFASFGVAAADRPRQLGRGIALALVLRALFIAAGAALIEAFRPTFLGFGAILLFTAARLLRQPDHAPQVRRRRTPVLVVLAVTDLLFALDSIPAVYGITAHPLIVLAANAFALLGMRSLFFVVAGLLDRLVHLQTGLAAVLAFIGVKLILHFAGVEIATGPSLAVITGILAVTTITSLRATRDATREIHARPHTETAVPERC